MRASGAWRCATSLRVVRGRPACPDVEELPHALLLDQVGHRAREELPRGPGDGPDLRGGRQPRVAGLAIDRVVVRAGCGPSATPTSRSRTAAVSALREA